VQKLSKICDFDLIKSIKTTYSGNREARNKKPRPYPIDRFVWWCSGG